MAKRGLNRAQLGRAIEISHVAIQNYVRGREPNPRVLVALADYFQVSTDWLLGRHEGFTGGGPVEVSETPSDDIMTAAKELGQIKKEDAHGFGVVRDVISTYHARAGQKLHRATFAKPVKSTDTNSAADAESEGAFRVAEEADAAQIAQESSLKSKAVGTSAQKELPSAGASLKSKGKPAFPKKVLK